MIDVGINSALYGWKQATNSKLGLGLSIHLSLCARSEYFLSIVIQLIVTKMTEASCTDQKLCDCAFRDCFSSAVHDIGQWKNCDMCVCTELNSLTQGNDVCRPASSAKPLVQCQLSIQSDHSTGCRLILTPSYLIVFSFLGILMSIFMVFCIYNAGGWYLYKTRLAQVEEDSSSDEDDDTGNDCYKCPSFSLHSKEKRDIYGDGCFCFMSRN